MQSMSVHLLVFFCDISSVTVYLPALNTITCLSTHEGLSRVTAKSNSSSTATTAAAVTARAAVTAVATTEEGGSRPKLASVTRKVTADKIRIHSLVHF